MLRNLTTLLVLIFSISTLAKNFEDLAPDFVNKTVKDMETLRPNGKGAPSCLSAVPYLRSRLAYGLYEEVDAYYKNCPQKSLNVQALLLVANAYQRRYRWSEAELVFEKTLATNDPGALFSFAKFLWNHDQETRAKEVLALYPSWDSTLALATIEKLGRGTTNLATTEEVHDFLKPWHQGPSDTMKAQAILGTSHLHRRAYENLLALNHLYDNFLQLRQPDSYMASSFASFYSGATPDLRSAKKYYGSTVAYTHKLSRLPQEQNVFSYGELYADVCKAKLLAESELEELNTKKEEWLSGTISSDDFLQYLVKLNQDHPDKSDVLSHLGGMYEIFGNDSQASDHLWSSHQLCPYYNRSHRGLFNIKRRRKNRSYSDHGDLIDRSNRALAGKKFPQSLEQYIINWNSLEALARERVKYSLLLWRPYVEWLHSNDNRAYIKYSFQLLSESPGLSRIRDRRVSYSNDGRLWDDIRGLGGSTVVAEYDEVMEVPFGAYGLLNHEVAHQFHENLPPSGRSCIAELYRAAKTRDQFADSYSGRNEMEYFAQGATYWMIPEDSPKRFGTNRSWFIKNDPDLSNWLSQIERGVDPDLLICPVAFASPMLMLKPFPDILPAISLMHSATHNLKD